MTATNRMIELDVLRGFAVAVMVLVVSPGAWEFTYSPLQHANWHGWSFADLVFPDFLFGVGMALGLTFGRSLDPVNAKSAFWLKVGRRVTLLIALGLALNYLSIIIYTNNHVALFCNNKITDCVLRSEQFLVRILSL